MRGLWSETCARGTNAALVDLLAFARARLDIYANTVSQINYLSHSLTLRGTWSRHADPMSSMYRGMEANRLFMGLDNDGFLYGITRWIDSKRIMGRRARSLLQRRGRLVQMGTIRRRWLRLRR